MSKYTVELCKLFDDNNFKLFDFNYKLYDDKAKKDFEEFFINYFYFNEIGFPTIGKFKKALQNKLNVIYYKYKEYYKTCLEVENRDFMNTKEITETFEREVDGVTNAKAKANTENNFNGNDENINIYSATPKNNINNLDHFMTNATKDTNVTNNNSTSISNTENDTTNKQIEKTTFTSTGNLGVSSDGFLIEKWREIIIDINEKICSEELSELFMQVY